MTDNIDALVYAEIDSGIAKPVSTTDTTYIQNNYMDLAKQDEWSSISEWKVTGDKGTVPDNVDGLDDILKNTSIKSTL